MLFDKLVVWDRLEERIILIVNIKTDAVEENYRRGLTELDKMARVLETGKLAKLPPLRIIWPPRPLFDKARYCAMVERAKRYIRGGGCFPGGSVEQSPGRCAGQPV
jgi:anthranilate synthase component 1